MPAGAATADGTINPAKARTDAAFPGPSSILAPKKDASPAPDAARDVGVSSGAGPVPGVGSTVKGARGAASKRKDLRSPSPKEQSPALADAQVPSPVELERQKLMKQLEKSSASLTKRLVNIEGTIAEIEESYITSTWQHGNVLRGWDGYIRRVDRNNKNSAGNGSGSATGAPKIRKPKQSDRIFSLSSQSSQLSKDIAETQALKKTTQQKKKKKR